MMNRKTVIYLINFLGKISSYVYPPKVNAKGKRVKEILFSGWISGEFKYFGQNALIKSNVYLLGAKYISIGENCSVGKRTALTAWDKYGNDVFDPQLILKKNVSIGDDSHITAINRIEIGNNVLTGKKITITDNSHGRITLDILGIPPIQRSLYSEGPVIIDDGVWIGDKVTILANVHIGKNAIIGANAVVTKDIPANCVAAGIPAKVIKMIN